MARRRSGRKIDFTHWQLVAASSLAQSSGSVAINLATALHEPETLLRMRGNLLAYLDGTQAPGALIDVGVGVIAVPEGTGATNLWAPIDDSDAPWIWVEYFELGYEEMVTDVIDIPMLPIYRSVVDSKAMRILRNQELQVVFQNVTVGSAASFNASVCLRTLAGQ